MKPSIRSKVITPINTPIAPKPITPRNIKVVPEAVVQKEQYHIEREGASTARVVVPTQFISAYRRMDPAAREAFLALLATCPDGSCIVVNVPKGKA
jgi:hypothetical protein